LFDTALTAGAGALCFYKKLGENSFFRALDWLSSIRGFEVMA